MSFGLVVGAGGPIGMAWTAAKLIALEAHTGRDPRTADAFVGTSQGALTVALLASGIGTADLQAWFRRELPKEHPLRHRPPQRPRGQRGVPWPASPRLALRGLSGRVSPIAAMSGLLPAGTITDDTFFASVEALHAEGAWVDHPRTYVVAVDYDTGKRVAFGSPRAPACGIREAVRASGAVPGLIAPVEIAGRRYVDGGVVSSTSADFASGMQEVTVLAPMCGPAVSLPRSPRAAAGEAVRRQVVRRLKAEVAKLEAAGTQVSVIVPSKEEAAVMGDNLLSPKRRFEVFEAVLAGSLRHT